MLTIDVRVLVPDDTDPEVLVARLAGFEGEPPVDVLGAVALVPQEDPLEQCGWCQTVPNAMSLRTRGPAHWRGEEL